MVAALAVELTTARAETEAWVEAIKKVSRSVENVDIVGSESSKIHFTGRLY